MSVKRIPAGSYRSELTISNSRFIASVGPAFSAEEARAFIREIKDEFQDASHNVPAFIIGHERSIIEHSHDDGEPSGTAGRPILAALRGSGLGDIVVVVTRYFGGIKLGKGGLVRAYRDAAKEVLQNLPLARKTATDTIEIKIEYPLFERLRILVNEYDGLTIGEEFTEIVRVTVQIETERLDAFQNAIESLSLGQARVTMVSHDPDTILPLNAPRH